MARLDPAEEQRRLKETYSQMGDGELTRLAHEAFDLTDAAKEVLRAELAARGMDVPLVESREALKKAMARGLAVPAAGDLVAAYRAADLAEARIAKDLLESAGIPCFFGPEGTDDLDAMDAELKGGLDLKVRDVDQLQARWVLSHIRSSDPEPPGEYVPECPNCHSPEIVFQGLEEEDGDEAKFHWSCDACGHNWVDDGVAERP